MNERIQGVYVYGGGPQQHYVFTGQAQRDKRRFLAKLFLVFVLAVVFAWCMRSAYLAIAEPPQAAAETAHYVQVQQQETTQQPDRA